jgi:transcriptional regulator with XRE-family HTH domain
MPDTTAGHFATMLSTAMSQRGLTTRELSNQLGISYEHARRLQSNEALPSKLLAEKIAGTVGLDADAAWQAAQRDKVQRKFGTQLLAETTGTSDRMENFRPLIDSLLPEQVPHALAMLSGLVAAAMVKQSTLATTPEEHAKIQKGREALQDSKKAVLPVVEALKDVLTAKHKRKMRGEPEDGAQ